MSFSIAPRFVPSKSFEQSAKNNKLLKNQSVPHRRTVGRHRTAHPLLTWSFAQPRRKSASSCVSSVTSSAAMTPSLHHDPASFQLAPWLIGRLEGILVIGSSRPASFCVVSFMSTLPAALRGLHQSGVFDFDPTLLVTNLRKSRRLPSSVAQSPAIWIWRHFNDFQVSMLGLLNTI